MSLSLISRPNRSASLGLQTGQATVLTLFQFDVSIDEQFEKTAEVTDHPVENGADISDHVRKLPEEIVIRGWVSNDPIAFLASREFGPAPRTRAEDAYTELRRIMDESERVKVVTSLRELDNMVLTSIAVKRDKDSGRILDATIRLREIIVASTEVTAAPVPASTSSTRTGKENLGRQSTTEADAATDPAASESVLSGLFGGA